MADENITQLTLRTTDPTDGLVYAGFPAETGDPDQAVKIGGPFGLVSLDGAGKVPQTQLPPLDHDVGEAADEAGMLALSVTAPAVCIRTDFTPPHVFYLTADPATELTNWVDTGEFGAGGADPSVTVGLVAKNGVANSFMRSDAAPALDQAIVPTWTGVHTFNGSNGTSDPSIILGNNTPELRFFATNGTAGARMWRQVVTATTGASTLNIFAAQDNGNNNGYAFQLTQDGSKVTHSRLIAGSQNIEISGNQAPGIASTSGSGAWAHTGNFTTTGTIAGNVSVTAGIGSNSVQMAGAPNGQDVKIHALGVTDANVSIEFQAKGTGLLKMASPTTVAGNLTVAGELSAAQGAGVASPTNSGIALATAPNWSMAQFYDADRTANNRSMDILFIGDGLHMRFVNDARNAFLDFLSVQGGQALGVTGIASTSGSGAWTHTGAFSITSLGTFSASGVSWASNNAPWTRDGTTGTLGDVWTSQGNAVTPKWVTPLPQKVASTALIDQSADASNAAFYAVPADGTYRVSVYIVLTRAATTSATLPGCNVSYTDLVTNVAMTSQAAQSVVANVVGTHLNGAVVLEAKSGTDIGFSTSGYASSGATTMQYRVRVVIERLV